MSSQVAKTVPGRTDRAVVMGVLNVTPDSFSDGGRYSSVEHAVQRAVQMVAEGADVIDVGGESTRPGASQVSAEEEADRVLPVIRLLAERGMVVSVDTYRAGVAAAAIEAGARIVNDVSGGLADAGMAAVVRDAGCPWVLMHWRGHAERMSALATYTDVVAEVGAELMMRVDAATSAGVDAGQLILDPGIGFAKTASHNWTLLAHLDGLVALGFPILVAASRKSFLGALLADPGGTSRPPELREDATVAITTHAVLNGAWGVRVHEVAGNRDAAMVASRLRSSR